MIRSCCLIAIKPSYNYEKIEFSYYDWNEFKNFLDQLSDKDAAKLIETI